MPKVTKQPMEMVGQIKGLKADVKLDAKTGAVDKVLEIKLVAEGMSKEEVGDLYELASRPLRVTITPEQIDLPM
jgi:hypothetical protein